MIQKYQSLIYYQKRTYLLESFIDFVYLKIWIQLLVLNITSNWVKINEIYFFLIYFFTCIWSCLVSWSKEIQIGFTRIVELNLFNYFLFGFELKVRLSYILLVRSYMSIEWRIRKTHKFLIYSIIIVKAKILTKSRNRK